jgi:hypothetical protein
VGIAGTINQSTTGKENNMVLDISIFADTAEKQEVLFMYSRIRNEALNLVYTIDGYREAPLAVKNAIYDTVKNRLVTLETERR